MDFWGIVVVNLSVILVIILVLIVVALIMIRPLPLRHLPLAPSSSPVFLRDVVSRKVYGLLLREKLWRRSSFAFSVSRGRYIGSTCRGIGERTVSARDGGRGAIKDSSP